MRVHHGIIVKTSPLAMEDWPSNVERIVKQAGGNPAHFRFHRVYVGTQQISAEHFLQRFIGLAWRETKPKRKPATIWWWQTHDHLAGRSDSLREALDQMVGVYVGLHPNDRFLRESSLLVREQ